MAKYFTSRLILVKIKPESEISCHITLTEENSELRKPPFPKGSVTLRSYCIYIYIYFFHLRYLHNDF